MFFFSFDSMDRSVHAFDHVVQYLIRYHFGSSVINTLKECYKDAEGIPAPFKVA